MTSTLKRRHLKDKWFWRACLCSLSFALLFLASVFGDILYKGYPAFTRTEIKGERLNSTLLNPYASYQVGKEKDWIVASREVDMYYKYDHKGNLPSEQIHEIESLKEQGRMRLVFNWAFFTHSDSREPELAGIWGAFLGSLMVLVVAVLTAFPLGIGAALYLEEFAPKNRFSYLIEANINNLAAVPTIVFGLLGLFFFIHFLNLPRASALVGGLTLSLMSLPIIVVATRSALFTVPSTLREAAFGLGASHLQVLFHHVIPKALPGIMTGAILSMARVLGETAPLTILGMVAFIANPPTSFFDPTTVLSIQIFNWSKSPEMGFTENTSAAILILLSLVIILNGIAVFIRKKFES